MCLIYHFVLSKYSYCCCKDDDNGCYYDYVQSILIIYFSSCYVIREAFLWVSVETFLPPSTGEVRGQISTAETQPWVRVLRKAAAAGQMLAALLKDTLPIHYAILPAPLC